ncbi:MAG: c-type cytochrome [Pseudomonadota bacterium]
MLNLPGRTITALISFGLLGAAIAYSQDERLVAAVSSPVRQADQPTNVQVLPRDLSRAGVRRIMEQFERELGVTCSYCHVEDRDSGAIDYASDENPAKQTARVMITMLDDINEKYLAQLSTDRRYAVPVTCGSCHQGHSSPLAFEPR